MSQFDITRVVAQLRRAVVALIVINALVGIVAILGGTGDLEWEILGTTMLITAGASTAAVNGTAVDRGVARLLCWPSIVLSWFAYAWMIVWIWRDAEPVAAIQDATFIALTLGVGGTFAALLLQVKVLPSFEPARFVAIAADVWLVVMTLIAILSGPSIAELFAVASIVAAAASLIVIVGTRNVKADVVDRVVAFCPACGANNGDGACSECGANFAVTFTD